MPLLAIRETRLGQSANSKLRLCPGVRRGQVWNRHKLGFASGQELEDCCGVAVDLVQSLNWRTMVVSGLNALMRSDCVNASRLHKAVLSLVLVVGADARIVLKTRNMRVVILGTRCSVKMALRYDKSGLEWRMEPMDSCAHMVFVEQM